MCNSSTYLGRGWCRLEQWAAMAASSSTDHMWLYENNDLHKLAETPEWIEESVNVFTGKFTCSADKNKLVDVVLALYAYCIVCGRFQPKKEAKPAAVSTATASVEEGTAVSDAEKRLWLSALIDRNRKNIFPPEWFGDSVEILEAEIQKCLERKKCVRVARRSRPQPPTPAPSSASAHTCAWVCLGALAIGHWHCTNSSQPGM